MAPNQALLVAGEVDELTMIAQIVSQDARSVRGRN